MPDYNQNQKFTQLFYSLEDNPLLRLPLTIGADPELELQNPLTDEFIHASTVISDNHNDQPFGLDGASSTAELRPEPAQDPLTLTDNIYSILKNYSRLSSFNKVYDLRFQATSHNLTLGGHIHLGHLLLKSNLTSITDRLKVQPLLNFNPIKQLIMDYKKNFSSYSSVFISLSASENPHSVQVENHPNLPDPEENILEDFLRDFSFTRRNKIIELLDNFLSIPLLFCEVPSEAKFRKRNGYGALNCSRSQDHGFEYRTPPSWISERKLTEAVLCLAYSLARDSLLKNYQPKMSLVTDLPGFNDLFRCHYSGLIKPFLKPIIKEIRTNLPSYKLYSQKIEYLLKNASHDKPLLITEIKEGWNIPSKLTKILRLLSLKELNQKIIRTLPRLKDLKVTAGQNLIEPNNDFMVAEIAGNLNKSFHHIFPSFHYSFIKPTLLKGNSQTKGGLLTIWTKEFIPSKRRKLLKKCIEKILPLFCYKKPIDIKLYPPYHYKFCHNTSHAALILLPYDVRNHNSFLAETIVLICQLFINKWLYRSYKLTRRGIKQPLPLNSYTLLKIIKKNLAGVKRDMAKKTILTRKKE
jgi:hypothetical protein